MLNSIFDFQPQPLFIPRNLKPFIPRYMASTGDTDTFTKVARPDGMPEYLGLTALDEPGPVQSNPSILEMQLRNNTSLGKQKKGTTAAVRTVNPDEKGALV